ncbi:hypothetical protein HMPREF3231_01267 [Bifidobacterium longum]|nr:hypothetical protein HMPREF3231_01267 [Bifidobacterium longum]
MVGFSPSLPLAVTPAIWPFLSEESEDEEESEEEDFESELELEQAASDTHIASEQARATALPRGDNIDLTDLRMTHHPTGKP